MGNRDKVIATLKGCIADTQNEIRGLEVEIERKRRYIENAKERVKELQNGNE